MLVLCPSILFTSQVMTTMDTIQDSFFAGHFLTSFFSTRLAKFPPRTLIYVSFDEDSYHDNLHVLTVLIGDMIPPGVVSDHYYDHYSLLKTVELNFHLGDLGQNDVTAQAFELPGNLRPPPTGRPTHVRS